MFFFFFSTNVGPIDMLFGTRFQCSDQASLNAGREQPVLLDLTDVEVFSRMMPLWITSRSNGGASWRKCSYWLVAAEPHDRSTPARLYQDWLNRTISPAAGKWTM